MKSDTVIQILKKQERELLDQYGVTSIYLFGSVARGDARPDSDVDLLVDFKEPVGLFTFIGLQQRLETLLGCKVDLSTRRALKPHFYRQVLQEAIRVA